jgi:hypothetical protein
MMIRIINIIIDIDDAVGLLAMILTQMLLVCFSKNYNFLHNLLHLPRGLVCSIHVDVHVDDQG